MDRAGQAGPVAGVLAWSVLLFLLLPITVVFPLSLTDQRFLSLPYESLSLQHYVTFFTSERWLGSTGQSLVIAVFSTVLAVVSGTLTHQGVVASTTKNKAPLSRTLRSTSERGSLAPIQGGPSGAVDDRARSPDLGSW